MHGQAAVVEEATGVVSGPRLGADPASPAERLRLIDAFNPSFAHAPSDGTRTSTVETECYIEMALHVAFNVAQLGGSGALPLASTLPGPEVEIAATVSELQLGNAATID